MAFIQPAAAQSVPAGKTLPQDNFRQEICLNGLWDFKCDADGEWTQIRVPGCYSVIQDGKWGKNLWDAFLYPKSWTGKGGTYKRRIESLKPLIVSSFQKNTVKQEVLILGNEMMQELAPLIKNRMGENYEVKWNTKTLGNSDVIPKNIEPWLKEKQEWDMILIIIGEEDIKTPADGKTTTVEQYSANVEKIMETLGKTKAKLYLCTLPPVPDKAKGYEPSLPQTFNSAAKTIADKYDVYTFDLYDFIGRNYPEYLRSDVVAFPVSMKRNVGKQLGEALISFGAQVVN
jgi:lysophospholipase L1-like esterase